MKGTAACIIWYTLLDCRDSYKMRMSGHDTECPGCRISDFKTPKECGGCLFNNVFYMGMENTVKCARNGKKILEAMEDV